MPLHVIFAAAMVAASVPVVWWVVASGREPGAQTVARNLAARGPAPADARRALLQRPAWERAVEPAIAMLANRGRRVTPAGMIDALDQKLRLSASRTSAEHVLATKLGLGLLGGMLGFLAFLSNPSSGTLLLALGPVAVGYTAPDTVLQRRAATRQKAIQKDLSDTIDQITVSVEAGLGFEAALARVAQTGTGPIAEELSRTLQDIQLGVRRRDAMDRLLDRTDVDDLRRFVHAVRQAEEYGIPIAQVLRVQSAELRDKRRQRAEEQAMKLPVKIIFPVIFCILPSLFLVVMGPIVVRFAQGDLFPS